MSHSLTGPRGTRFAFNSDGSGDAEILTRAEQAPLQVPVDDLLAFVAELVRHRRIAEFEDATPEELLGLPRGKR